jgi:hypothetical protein
MKNQMLESTPTALASKIRTNADHVLKALGLPQSISQFGKLYFTGSYHLDLMTWNDIDLQIVLKKDKAPMQSLLEILPLLATSENLLEGKIINFSNDYKPKMPRGVYLGLNVNFPELGGNWKVDLWALSEKDFHKNHELIQQLQERLTPKNREHILSLKHQLMKTTGRVPQMGSHFLYQAILIENLWEPKEIFAFMKKHGVPLDQAT